MSQGYENRKTLRRLAWDITWPERVRIRNLIKRGTYARYSFDGLDTRRKGGTSVNPGRHIRIRGWMKKSRLVSTMARIVDYTQR